MTWTDYDYLCDTLDLGSDAELSQALSEVYGDAEFIDPIPTGDHWA